MADPSPNTPNPLRQGPENYGTLAEALKVIISSALKQTENMLPCRVVSYDRVQNVAVVHPLIRVAMSEGNYSRVQIGPIPVFAAGAGGFVMNFPIKAGDLGWMLANDRDITNFLESLDESDVGSFRQHSFNDAILFPDSIRNFDTTGEDGNMVIQSSDGKIRISLGQSQIKLTHPTKVFLDTPLVDCLKDIHAAGTITGDTDVVFAGISAKAHKHGKGTLQAPNGPLVSGDTDIPHG